MFGITPLQLFLHLMVVAAPERRQIPGDLHRAPRRRQQVQQHRDTTVGQYRSAGLTKHLLQRQRQYRVAVGRVLDTPRRAGRGFPADRQQRIDALAKTLNMEDFIERYTDGFSQGQQVKVAIDDPSEHLAPEMPRIPL